MIDIAY